MIDVDELLRLEGDEEGGVSLVCRRCDRRGLPIAFYQPADDGIPPYLDRPDVEQVSRIVDLYVAALHHAGTVHS